MPVRFFGQFLLEEGVIEPHHLRQANDHMTWLNRNLGELAQKEGLLTSEQVQQVLREQAGSCLRFGEIALALGLLTRNQLSHLVTRQAAQQAKLGDSLVELGHLSEARLKELLGRFEAEQVAFAAQSRHLPPELAESGLARAVLEWFPRVSVRLAGVQLKLGLSKPWPGDGPNELQTSMRLSGAFRELETGLACEQEFAVWLAERLLHAGPTAADAPICALEILLLRVAELALSEQSPGEACVPGPLQRGTLPESGVAVEFVSLRGRGLIILHRSR